MKKERVLQRFKEEYNILHKIERKKAYQNGLVLHRNPLLKHVVGGETEKTRRARRRRKQPLEVERGKYYFALFRIVFGRAYGPAVGW